MPALAAAAPAARIGAVTVFVSLPPNWFNASLAPRALSAQFCMATPYLYQALSCFLSSSPVSFIAAFCSFSAAVVLVMVYCVLPSFSAYLSVAFAS